MPKKIHGKPVDEEKWSKAKALAAEQGHAEEYDYIMGIYLRMVKKSGPILGKVLEKGRPAAALGTRKQQKQKRMKKGKAIYTWVWVKRTVRGWEYDGMVSPAERKAAQTVERREKRGQKLVDITKQKVAEAKAQAKKKQKADYKPSAAEIAKMPTKQKMYWDDPRVTKERQSLCDQTGILTLDDKAEKYVRDNMQRVFQTNEAQDAILGKSKVELPLDTDGKAFDDPLFMDDALQNLKQMKSMLMSTDERLRRERQLADDWLKMDRYEKSNYGDSLNNYKEKVNDKIKEVFDVYIEAFEKHENDKVVTNKMAAFDRGVRAIKHTRQFDTILVEELFGGLEDVTSDNTVDWADIPEDYKPMLEAWGLSEDDWSKRKWGRYELLGFGLSTLNDDFRKNVFMPWLEVWGNTITDTFTYPRDTYSGQRIESMEYIRDAELREYIDFDTSKEPVMKFRGTMNPETVKFMNEMFKYQAIGLDDTKAKNFRDKKITSAQELIRGIQDAMRASPSGTYNSYIYGNPADRERFDEFMEGRMLRGSQVVQDEFGMGKFVTWRDFANGVKAMRRRKGFKNDKPAMLDAIADAGKALGTTSRSRTGDKFETVLNSLMRDLSKPAQRAVEIPDKETIGTYFTGVQLGSSRSGYMYRGKSTGQWGNLTGGGSAVDKDDKAAKSILRYRQWRKSSKYAGGRAKQTTFSYNSTMPAKTVTKTKYMNEMFNQGSGWRGARADGLVGHIKSSIITNMGLNWNLKKITKDDDVVPDFKWNPKLVPFGQLNPYSHTGVRVSSGWGGASSTDSLGRKNLMGQDDYKTLLQEQYRNSVADILGLGIERVKVGRGRPSIVLSTSKMSVGAAQSKIDSEWTHDKQALRGNGWAKGSVKVLNVFDINHHEYYKDYKKIEAEKGNVQYVYHGTDYKAAASIIKGGYIVPRQAKAGRAFGNGVYFAKSSSKSCGYLHSGSWGRYDSTGVLLWNRVAMGKTTDPNNPRTGDPSYDTIWAGGKTGGFPNSWLDHDEWCVRNPKAAVPIQWIEVTTK